MERLEQERVRETKTGSGKYRDISNSHSMSERRKKERGMSIVR